jgi:hypothetical protein
MRISHLIAPTFLNGVNFSRAEQTYVESTRKPEPFLRDRFTTENDH